MARGTQLQKLVTMLQAELGQVITAAPANLTLLQQLLSDKQKWLATEYDWPFLEDRFDVAVPGGGAGRYNSFPTTDDEGLTNALNTERPLIVEVFWNNIYTPVLYGIGSNEYNYLNSNQPGQTQDPIQRWRWSAANAFEVWPVPVTPQAVRFTGQRQLDPLVASTDTADLDDQIIVLAVAAELLARNKQQDAQLKLSLFNERMRRVRGSYPGRPTNFTLGEGRTNKGPSQGTQLVSVRVGVAGN